MAISTNSDAQDYAYIKIGNTQLTPFPTSYDCTYEDLDSESSRNVNTGVLTRNRVRKGVHTLSLSYDLLTRSQAHTIISLIDGASFNVTFFSLYENKQVTKKMYASNKTFNWVVALPLGSTKYQLMCQKLSFQLIEY